MTENHRVLQQFDWRFVPFHWDWSDKEVPEHWEHDDHEGHFSEAEALALVAKELEQEHEATRQENLNAYWNDPDYH